MVQKVKQIDENKFAKDMNQLKSWVKYVVTQL